MACFICFFPFLVSSGWWKNQFIHLYGSDYWHHWRGAPKQKKAQLSSHQKNNIRSRLGYRLKWPFPSRDPDGVKTIWTSGKPFKGNQARLTNHLVAFSYFSLCAFLFFFLLVTVLAEPHLTFLHNTCRAQFYEGPQTLQPRQHSSFKARAVANLPALIQS